MPADRTAPLLALALLAACGRHPAAPASAPAPGAGREVPGAEGRTVYDFVANRPLALVYEQGALVIEGTAPDIYKFMDGGWKASLIVDRDRDPPGVLADGLAAVLHLPGSGLVEGARPLQLTLWLRPADVPRQALTVLINERPAANLEIAPGAHVYRVALRALLQPGENTLRLHFRAAGTIGTHHSAAALTRLTLGPAAAHAPPDEARPAGRACTYSIGADARHALCAGADAGETRWSYFLVPPDAGAVTLAFGYGVRTEGRPTALAVRAARDGEPAQELFTGRAEPGRWQEARIDMSRMLAAGGGRALRLDFTLAGPGAVAQPRLLRDGPGPGQEALSAAWPGPARAEHLVVYAVDALRGDRLDPARDRAPTGSGAAQLLQQGVRLPAVSQGNYGLPAHASLLSGTYPARHHLLRETDTLPPDVTLLPEALQRAGFATALFSASGYVSERWGLSRGFDVSRNLVREGLGTTSADLLRLARPWLKAQVASGRRLFLYMAAADPHAPYSPPAALLSGPHPCPGPLRPPVTAEQLVRIKRGALKLGPADRACLEALYDAEVAESDATLGQLLATLRDLGIAGRTAVVLAGTHGEEFFDHGSVGHGHTLYQELIGVPLVLSFPPRLGHGRSIRGGSAGAPPPSPGEAGRASPPVLAELVDLAPTLLHLLGSAVPESMQGQSLLPLLAAGAPAMPRPGFAQAENQRSVQLGRYQLIATSGEHLLLYDLSRDPREAHDVAAAEPIALRALRHAGALFHAYQARWHKARMGTPANLAPGFTSEDPCPAPPSSSGSSSAASPARPCCGWPRC